MAQITVRRNRRGAGSLMIGGASFMGVRMMLPNGVQLRL